jgi:hypothetical protein
MRPAIFRLVSVVTAVVGAAGLMPPGGAHLESARDPFAFLAPSTVVSAEDRARLDRDEVLSRTLRAHDGQVAILVAARLDARPDALAAWTRAIAELKRSRFVLAVGRFSDPPRLADLEGLTLDPRDLEEVRDCRPGSCGLKLSAAEMEALTAAGRRAGDGWRAAAQREFRRLVLARVERYRAAGLSALPPPADGSGLRRPDGVLAGILDQSPYLATMPAVVRWLTQYPNADAGVESFFYWSKEHYGDGKPVISVTHVGMLRPDSSRRLPAILVAGKQILATHYIEGGVSVTMIVADDRTGARYLVYVNRTQVDLLRGFFGGMIRRVLEGRLERHAPQIMRGLRARLESGDPPGGTASGLTDGR